MRNNKILSAAIMAALAGAGASPFASAVDNFCRQPIAKSMAGSCAIGLSSQPPGTGSWNQPVFESAPPLPQNLGKVIATEIIGDGWLVDDNANVNNGATTVDKRLTAVYCLGAGSSGPGVTGGTIQTDFYVTYTLTGAKFVLTSDSPSTTITAENVVLPGGYGVKGTDFRSLLANPTSSLGTGGAANSQTSVSLAYVSPEQNVVKFLVQAQTTNKINEGDTLYFSFDIKDFDVLQSNGGSVSLATSFVKANGETMSLAGDCSSTIVTSTKAVDAVISSKNVTTDNDKTVYIDVESSSAKFTSASGKDHSTTTGKEGCFAVLGSLDLTKFNSSGKLSDLTASAGPGSLSASEGVFTIENAPLNGTGATICIDTGSTAAGTLDLLCGNPESTTAAPKDSFDLPSKDNPVQISGETTATFKLSGADAEKLIGQKFNILIGVDCTNATAIKPLDGPARAKLVLTFSDTPNGTAGGNKAEYTGTLKQIKRNGSDCTLYNVPSPSALETANVRVTNKSGKEAKLYGILTAKDGSPVFGSAQSPIELGTFVDQQTLYFDSAALAKIAAAQKGNPDWGRGVLRLISGASKIEAYGLIRGKVEGAPLMNMSTGASGDGCD